MNKNRFLVPAAGLAAFLAAGVMLAQRRAAPGYDASAEKTVAGTVQAVTAVPGGRRGAGLHVTLASGNESWEVRLGPESYAKRIGLSLAKGDSIEVTGSADAAHRTLVAREVKKGDKTFRLRDAEGFPLWSRGRR
jgi:hypothetical protein